MVILKVVALTNIATPIQILLKQFRNKFTELSKIFGF